MALWTDVVTPVELTTVSRRSFEERERDKGSLSDFLPNQTVNDIDVRLTASSNGLVEAAQYRAYDAETPIGSTPGGRSIRVELPPVGQKIRVSEYDQIRQRNRVADDTLVRNAIGQVAVQVGRAIADRIELERGRVLATGQAAINENQFIATQDFGRDADMSVQATTPWGSENAAVVEELAAWVDAYVAKNGQAPGTLLMSKTAFMGLSRNDQIRSMISSPAGAPALVSADHVRSVFAAYDLPEIRLYDRSVNVGGAYERVIPADTAILLPSESGALGSTFFGTTLEAADPRYALDVEDRPGIAVGSFRDDDPAGVWVHGAAIAMPILADANLAMAANIG